jgi:hypothetical protein
MPAEFNPDIIETLTLEKFRRFGIACCYRLKCDRKDKRLAKALSKLEQSLGPPLDEKLRRDAQNIAQSVYQEVGTNNSVLSATACTLVCACWNSPIPNLIGNFESALKYGEFLSRTEIRKIESEILRAILNK